MLAYEMVYSTDIWYILWPFGIFFGYLAHISRFSMFYQEKSGNPDQLILVNKLLAEK
jgi:hypothetical protein